MATLPSKLTGRGTPHDITVQAASDLSARQFTFVKLYTGVTGGTAATIEAQNAKTASGFILQDKPLSGKAGRIRIEGTSALKVDGNAGAIAVGDPLTADTAGLGVKAITTNFYGAVAMEASTAAGDIIEVLVQRGYVT